MAALPGLASDEDLFGSKLEMTLKLFCDDEEGETEGGGVRVVEDPPRRLC